MAAVRNNSGEQLFPARQHVSNYNNGARTRLSCTLDESPMSHNLDNQMATPDTGKEE